MIPIAIDVSLVILVGLLTIGISFLDSPSKANSPFRFVSLILRCVSIICIMFIGIRNYQTQTESMQSKEKLETSLADIASVQDLNTELQKQLVKSNAALAELAKANIDEVTGGDSFCYVEIRQMALTTGLLQAFVLGKGKNPLSDLRIRIVDLDVFDKISQAGLNEENMREAQRIYSFPLPTHYSGLLKPLYPFTLPPEEFSKRYNIFISARNGFFTENLRLRRVDKSWISAMRVTASYYDKRTGIVLERIDRDFPQDILQMDKDWMASAKSKRLKIQE